MTSRFALATIVAIAVVACEDPTRALAPSAVHFSTQAALQSGYTMTDLGSLGGGYSTAEAINHEGVVVGWSLTASGAFHAFVWVPDDAGGTGIMRDLGTLAGWDCSVALGIDSRANIVGYACSETETRPVRWRKLDDGSSYAIEELDGLGGHKGSANAINHRGDVVGNSCTIAGDAHVVRWSQTGMRDLGTGGGAMAIATDINAQGQITVVRDLGENRFTVGYVWSEKNGFRDIGNLGGSRPGDGTIADAINDRGEVAGYSVTAEGWLHAFFWSERAVMQDLGTLGGSMSVGLDINDFGEIVGWSETMSGMVRAYVWTRGRGMADLGSLVEGGFSSATAINAGGQIVGGSDMPDGSFRAALWTPRTIE